MRLSDRSRQRNDVRTRAPDAVPSSKVFAAPAEVHRADAAPAATDELWVEPRGATVLAWRLKPRAAGWRDLLAADEVAD